MSNLISSITRDMIVYYDGDPELVNHALKVYGFAKTIGELDAIPEDKLKILEAAAVLHDIGIPESLKKHSSYAGEYQQIEGPPIARHILEQYDLREDFIERVCYLIAHHHTYDKIDDVDYQILIEADFLVNIFEHGEGKEEAQTIRQKYFSTCSGISILDSMYIR